MSKHVINGDLRVFSKSQSQRWIFTGNIRRDFRIEAAKFHNDSKGREGTTSSSAAFADHTKTLSIPRIRRVLVDKDGPLSSTLVQDASSSRETTRQSVDPVNPIGEKKSKDPISDSHHQDLRIVPLKPTKAPTLPISPLMDPNYLEAKEKYRVMKATPQAGEQTPLQEELAQNPYALMLSTPIRSCRLTRVVLPRFFLLRFDLVEHPNISESWCVPRDLFRRSVLKPAPRSPRPGAYIQMRKLLLRAIMAMSSPYSNGYKTMMLPTGMSQRSAKKIDVHWRRDMENFTLELLRRRAMEDIRLLLRKGLSLKQCDDWEDAKTTPNVGALLWMGDIVEVSNFSTLQVSKNIIPVYNMRRLLGEEHLRALRESNPDLPKDILAVGLRKGPASLIMRLWQIQCFRLALLE